MLRAVSRGARSSWSPPGTTTRRSSARWTPGADDYVVKPFGVDQVAARIRAVLRRGEQPQERRGPAERRRAGDRPAPAHGRARRDAGRADPQGVRPARWPSPHGTARWSPSASCWPRSGSSRTAAATAPSTSTCPGCAASWARPPPSRATCTRCGGWASGWWLPSGVPDEAPDLAARRGDDISGGPGVRDPAVPARAQHRCGARGRRGRPGGAATRPSWSPACGDRAALADALGQRRRGAPTPSPRSCSPTAPSSPTRDRTSGDSAPTGAVLERARSGAAFTQRTDARHPHRGAGGDRPRHRRGAHLAARRGDVRRRRARRGC